MCATHPESVFSAIRVYALMGNKFPLAIFCIASLFAVFDNASSEHPATLATELRLTPLDPAY